MVHRVWIVETDSRSPRHAVNPQLDEGRPAPTSGPGMRDQHNSVTFLRVELCYPPRLRAKATNRIWRRSGSGVTVGG